MRISDWSSDVCSSDLTAIGVGALSIVDGITVIALARDDQIALAAADIVQRNALEIVLERGITLESIDQTRRCRTAGLGIETPRSEEHTSALQSLMDTSYDVLCLQTNKNDSNTTTIYREQPRLPTT